MSNSKYFKNNFHMTLNLFENQVKQCKFNENRRNICLTYPKSKRSIFFTLKKEQIGACNNRCVINIYPTSKYWATVYHDSKDAIIKGEIFGFQLIEEILSSENWEYESEHGDSYEAKNKSDSSQK